MIRLHFVVEGPTEEEFVNAVLSLHLGKYDIVVDAHAITTKRTTSRTYRGGWSDYQQLRKDVDLWIRQDRGADSYFTTVIDLYGLPTNFPGMASPRAPDPYGRVEHLERALGGDVGHPGFIPYVALHEFETLVLADPSQLAHSFSGQVQQIERLNRMVQGFESPELIDDGPDSSPSRRIIKEIPAYKFRKASVGPLLVGRIGVSAVRQRCPHFNSWLAKLESLGRS